MIGYGRDNALIRRPGLFISMILLTTFLAIAQDDYALVISGSDDGSITAECTDCFANIITQADSITIEDVRQG